MCHKGVCMMCIPVRTGCYVGAGIFMIYHILSFFGSIKSLMMMQSLFQLITNMLFFDMTVHFVSIIFTALLCHGIRVGRPVLVKTYFIFGLIATVLRVIYIFFLAAFTAGDLKLFAVIYALFECVMGSLFLVLVFHTHIRISKTPGARRSMPGLALA